MLESYTVDDLRDVSQNLRNARTAADALEAERSEIIVALLAQGYRQRELADAAGVTRGRIAQMAQASRRALPNAA